MNTPRTPSEPRNRPAEAQQAGQAPTPAANAAVAGALALRHPQNHPDTWIVVYDGHCQFCTKQVQRLQRWDRRGRLSFMSLHEPEVARRLPDLTHDQLMEEMVLLAPDGRRWGGAAAFRQLSWMLPPLWLLAPWLSLPGTLPLWAWCYRQVARQRYRWNRPTECAGSCDIHFRK